MSWYSKPYLIFFLYIAPTLFTVIAVFYFMLPRHKKVSALLLSTVLYIYLFNEIFL